MLMIVTEGHEEAEDGPVFGVHLLEEGQAEASMLVHIWHVAHE